MTALETDYLVVGAGAAGLAFTDTLVAHSGADVVLVDRRHRPGGHWLDAYPFVRLHQPSAHYGVASLPLGNDTIDRDGPNAGHYECATGAEVTAYFSRVLDEVLLPTGRVRFLGMHEYAPVDDGTHRATARLTGDAVDVVVRRKVVDATYLETAIPATHTPSFTVAPGVAMVPVNGLAAVDRPYRRYVVLGAGKTALDAALWLLTNGVPADRITWVRPRDPWLLDKRSFQPLDLVVESLAGFAQDLEAAAGAESVRHLFRRLEERGRVVRLDPEVEPEMYHCATVSQWELDRLRTIRDVVRLGHVTRIEPDELVLTNGTVPGGPDHLYVDCTAAALRRRAPKPVFEPGRVTLQQVRHCTPTFNAALIGYVEATRDDLAEQNRLCPPNPFPDTPRDWVAALLRTMAAFQAWQGAPDVAQWVEGCRLNFLSGALARAGDPRMQQAMIAFGTNLGPGLERLQRLLAEPEPEPEPDLDLVRA